MRVATMSEAEAQRVAAPKDDAGLGALRTDRGNLPLDRIDVHAAITGLVARIEVTQEFVNVHDDRAGGDLRLPAARPGGGDRHGDDRRRAGRRGELQERGAAREAYDRAHRRRSARLDRRGGAARRVHHAGRQHPARRAGQRAADAGRAAAVRGRRRPRSGSRSSSRRATSRAAPLPGEQRSATGTAPDTDAVPDASRITPAGAAARASPTRCGCRIDVDIDPAGLAARRGPLEPAHGDRDGAAAVRSSPASAPTGTSCCAWPTAARPDRRWCPTARRGPARRTGAEGTYLLTVLPPAPQAPPRPTDVVLLLDRSGSMGGWKMVAARRAAARIVDTLTDADRFAVLTFDDLVDTPPTRRRAWPTPPTATASAPCEHLAPGRRARRHRAARSRCIDGADAARPPRPGDATAGSRDRVLVLVTDGQVGNEDQILRDRRRRARAACGCTPSASTRPSTPASSAGSPPSAAAAASWSRARTGSTRRWSTSTGASARPSSPTSPVTAEGLDLIDDTQAPARLPDVFPGRAARGHRAVSGTG